VRPLPVEGIFRRTYQLCHPEGSTDPRPDGKLLSDTLAGTGKEPGFSEHQGFAIQSMEHKSNALRKPEKAYAQHKG
jgi:hypothetical protein